MKKTKSFNSIRWTARIIGTLMVVFTLFIGIAENLHGLNRVDASASDTFGTLMIITIIFWGVGLAGLLLALWKEGFGGIVSLLSFIIFMILLGINPNPDVRFMGVLFIFLIPSLLYLIYWWLKRNSSNKIS